MTAEVRSDLLGSGIPGLLKKVNKNIIFLLLGYKILVLALPLAFALVRPDSFGIGGYNANFHWPENKKPGLAERFMTWDGEHYLYLSANGYKAGAISDAFYPLWPALIYAGSKLTFGHDLIAALLLANLFSFLACILFHWLVNELYGLECANCALLLFLAYPGALFFQFPYSESLFLLLIILFFIAIFREKFLFAALTGFLLPLSRPIGVFCLLPLGWCLLERSIRMRKLNINLSPVRAFITSALKDHAWVACAAPLFGYASYFGTMYLSTGDPMSGFKAERFYVNQPSIMNILNLPGFIGAFFDANWGHGMADSVVDRAFFLAFVIGLPAIWRLNKTWFFYALGSGLVPAMSNWFFSYTRMLDVCFPLFVVLGAKLSGGKNRLILTYVVSALFVVQILFIIRQTSFRWVG